MGVVVIFKLLIMSASVCMDEERVHGEVLCGEMRQERVSGSNRW